MRGFGQKYNMALYINPNTKYKIVDSWQRTNDGRQIKEEDNEFIGNEGRS